MEHIEEILTTLVLWLKTGAEAIGIILIGAGLAIALFKLFSVKTSPPQKKYHVVRLALARFLVLGLEFQLAADILATAVKPSWDQLGRLGAIAAIRTFLNFFLQKELKEEEEEWKAKKSELEVKKIAGLKAKGD